jgi:hypothetical protein
LDNDGDKGMILMTKRKPLNDCILSIAQFKQTAKQKARLLAAPLFCENQMRLSAL